MSTTHTYTTPHPYFATYPIPIHTTPEHSVTPRDTTRSYPFVTLSTSTSIYTTTPSSLFTDSTVNFTFISNDTTVTPIHSYDITGAETTTPSSPYYMDDVIKPTETNYFEDVTSPSGTTVPSDDIIDWPDCTEYISVRATVPTTEQTTALPPTTTIATMTAKNKKPTWPPSRQEETRENNAIDDPYNRIIGVDNDISQNNLIPRRSRVFLRERTRNKRIQELLEEKRNFLLRMKRAHRGAV